jgi:hypothetical protein
MDRDSVHRTEITTCFATNQYIIMKIVKFWMALRGHQGDRGHMVGDPGRRDLHAARDPAPCDDK